MSDPVAGVLGRDEMRAMIESDRPLVTEWRDLDEQVQPNGFDMTLADVSRFLGPGTLPQGSAGRIQPDLEAVPFDADGFVTLQPGPYQIRFNEVVHLPNDLMAFGRPRSSLNRAGVTIHTAVWDAGYEGRSTSLLVVVNPGGWRVQRNARVLQLVFMTMRSAVARGYDGIYQRENLGQG